MNAEPLSADPAGVSPLPEHIGPYAVERLLGTGGMGLVYLCRDVQLDRPVAIKVLRVEYLNNAEMRARFVREARALARVASPAVVAVFAVGEDESYGPYVVMELLEGEDLSQRLSREGRLQWRDAVSFAKDACDGLLAVEDKGIVHRDVKPANLFVVKGSGRAKLTDFGLARELLSDGASVTASGLVVGTPAYIAPEVVRGADATPQSDVYSLGATLFHLIAGAPPFPGDVPVAVLADAVSKSAPRLDSRVNDIPHALVELVDAMLRKDPSARPQGFSLLRDRLHALMLGSLPPQPSTDVPRQVQATNMWGFPSPGSLTPRPPSMSPDALKTLVTTDTVKAKVRSASLTVMMTDIAGYTERTSMQSREESARWLALHDALLTPVFRAFAGRVVKTLGDTFVVTFPSPTDAVLCGCAVQDRLALHNAQSPATDKIVVRVALSTGDVRLHRGDVFGEPVNVVSRLQPLAHPGDVLLSDAVYATMNTAEVNVERLGEEQLRGIARAVTVYRANRLGGVELPYGGQALSRVKNGLWDRIRTRTPVMLARARGAIERGSARLLKRIPKRVQLLLASMFLLSLVTGVVWVSIVESRKARIARGEGKEVVVEIAELPAGARSARDWRDEGLALVAIGSGKTGFVSLERAVKLGVDDGDVLDAALAALGRLDPEGAEAVLAAWRNADEVNQRLVDLLSSPVFWARQHALEQLDARQVANDAQRVAVALLHVKAPECDMRRAGLLLLKRAGKGQEVQAAVANLAQNAAQNACMSQSDLRGTEEAVAKRSDVDAKPDGLAKK